MPKLRPRGLRGKFLVLSLEIYPDRETWLRGDPKIGPGRSLSFGASLAPDILGARSRERNIGALAIWAHFNPAVWHRLGFRPELDPEGRAKKGINLDARRDLEPRIGAMLAEDMGLAMIDPGDFAIVRNPDMPRLHSSPDLLALAAGGGVKPGELRLDSDRHTLSYLLGNGHVETGGELKTIHPYKRDEWGLEPDLPAIIQAHHTMYACGWRHYYVGAFVGYGDDDNERLTYRVEWDESLGEVYAEALDKIEGWIQRDEEPPKDGLDNTTRMVNLLFPAKAKGTGVSITLGAQWVAAHVEYLRVDSEIDRLEREKDRIRQEIGGEMGHHNAEEAIVPVDPAILPEGARWTRTAYVQSDSFCTCGEVKMKGGPRTNLRHGKMKQPKKPAKSKKKGGASVEE